jgi:glutathionylspermidine synthase
VSDTVCLDGLKLVVWLIRPELLFHWLRPCHWQGRWRGGRGHDHAVPHHRQPQHGRATWRQFQLRQYAQHIPAFRQLLAIKRANSLPRGLRLVRPVVFVLLQLTMHRLTLPERPDWRTKAEEYGFPFHTAGGDIYWDEAAAWSFTLREIEDDLEAPTAELEQMCLQVVAEAMTDDRLMERLAVPHAHWHFIRDSWAKGQRNLYGRFDLAYNGTGPAKLLEYNADTPTSLFEAAVFQWTWLEDQIAAGVLPPGSDQFNSLHEKLVEAFRHLKNGQAFPLHVATFRDSAEDRATGAYLADCARQAGLQTAELAIEDIGVNAEGRFTDADNRLIETLFKLYAWEWIFTDDFARHLATSRTQFIEPPWKALLSSKAILPVLWERAPNHPNLLPAFFADDPRAKGLANHVVKPIHSREGANISVRKAGAVLQETPGLYTAGPSIVQELAPLARHAKGHAVIGSWVVASQPAGIGIREDEGEVTRDLARFVPHVIAAG